MAVFNSLRKQQLALLLYMTTLVNVYCKDQPVFNPNFAANTIEIDEKTNETVVEQRLVFDIDNRRSMMYAQGSLVHGALQQIRRCDIHPEGWMTSAGGPNVQDPSTWACTNTTISTVGELPMNCQYSTFWGFPNDMIYDGVELKNGTLCDKWSYSSDGYDYSLWSANATNVTNGEIYDIPIANGEVSSWTVYYHQYVPGEPDISEYAPVEGNDCPPSTAPSS